MTPAARVAAAIDILDDIFDGEVVEKALSGWGRSHRFAGSKDRAAIRDLVFQALRCRSSYAWLGGVSTGRGVMLGAMRAAGIADDMFSGEGYGPGQVTEDETGQDLTEATRATRLDTPEWMLPFFDQTLGEKADEILTLLRDRAAIILRVNAKASNRERAQSHLLEDGIVTAPINDIDTALQVTENERRISNSKAYLDGHVDLQDLSSQQAVASLKIQEGTTVLDYCAGGGGKALAMAAFGAKVTAHDIDPRRMKDIEPRAQRAGVLIDIATPDALENLDAFDLVFCDAPCSGSGTWRRTPAAKWALTPDRVAELQDIQKAVLNDCANYVKPGGRLVYATCSLFAQENEDQVDAFLADHGDFERANQSVIYPSAQSDGFFYSELHRN